MARFSQQQTLFLSDLSPKEIYRMWNMLFGLYEIREMSPDEQKAYDINVDREIQKLEKILRIDGYD